MASELLTNKNAYPKMLKVINSYGEGRASKRTVQAILYKLGLRERLKEFYI